ncbi:MAG: lipid-A-disaccharide synthase [Desulfobacteraceae bacterium]|nr:lipid-A-disaccharide synthase [Desulfobacteraceae bacterium]
MDFFISAGEASGDLHGSYLARAIRSMAPDVGLSCLGGRLLGGAGAELVVDNGNISVVGASEVLAHVREIYRSWRKIALHLRRTRPELVILIDFPDFNFLLGRYAKRLGCRVMYYISPQIWAWREGRVKTMRKMADSIAVILPFEKRFYADRGVPVHYVGHPLIDVIGSLPDRAECRKRYAGSGGGPVIGILPGSRRSEVKLLFSILMDSAQRLSKTFPDAEFVIPVAPSLDPRDISRRAAEWRLNARIVENDTHGAIRASDLLIAVSGTVTLEAAILETPMIIVNRVSRLSGEIGKRLIRVKHAGLPNLIAGREIVPEFIQDAARPDLIGDAATVLLKSPELLEAQRSELRRVREGLGEPGIAERVARIALRTARKS